MYRRHQTGLGGYEVSTWLSPARYVNAPVSAAVELSTALLPASINGPRGLGFRETFSDEPKNCGWWSMPGSRCAEAGYGFSWPTFDAWTPSDGGFLDSLGKSINTSVERIDWTSVKWQTWALWGIGAYVVVRGIGRKASETKQAAGRKVRKAKSKVRKGFQTRAGALKTVFTG